MAYATLNPGYVCERFRFILVTMKMTHWLNLTTKQPLSFRALAFSIRWSLVKGRRGGDGFGVATASSKSSMKRTFGLAHFGRSEQGTSRQLRFGMYCTLRYRGYFSITACDHRDAERGGVSPFRLNLCLVEVIARTMIYSCDDCDLANCS